MAKGQQRSNREARKPKQDKAKPVVETSFGNQVKAATNANAKLERPGSGGKGGKGK